jgi:UDP-N-acetylmuramyl pentapeptide phosphotransferase/UDP-N-acetylglucosamine-1-phosphate transferase
MVFYVDCADILYRVLNAYNFMDGINGITGGYSLVVVGVLFEQ